MKCPPAILMSQVQSLLRAIQGRKRLISSDCQFVQYGRDFELLFCMMTARVPILEQVVDSLE